MEHVREDFLWAYKRLGGRKALLSWAGENEKEFFKMFFTLMSKAAEQGLGSAELVNALRELAGEDEG